MGCGAKCAKFFLFTVNVLVWLVGAAFLAIGIWIAVSPSTFVAQALNVVNASLSASDAQSKALANEVLSNTSLLMIGAYVMIAVGGLLFLIGFCGCCGACKESKCLLIIYIIFCSLAFLIALAAGIIEAVYLNQINFYLTQAFVSLQANAYDGMYNSTSAVSQLWFNIMQYSYCCGIYGPSDFTSSNKTVLATLWVNNNQYTCAGGGQCFSEAFVPASCCSMYSNSTVNPTCPTTGAGVYATGCQSAFITPFASQMHTYATIVMGVTFGLAAFCILAIVAASLLMCKKENGSGGDKYA